MKKLLLLIAAIAVFSLPATILADTFSFQAPLTAGNNSNCVAHPLTCTSNPSNSNYQGGANQFDLDHHLAYTWRIDNIDLHGQAITGATLTFSNVRNWDGNTNMLFVHLFDTASNAGAFGFADPSGATGAPVTNIFDDFTTASASNFIGSGVGNTFLGKSDGLNGNPLFNNTSSQTWTITFTPAQLQALSAYIANGHNIAFGFDPDCHYWNNGISFNFYTAAVPEPATLALLGTGLTVLYLRRRKQRKVA